MLVFVVISLTVATAIAKSPECERHFERYVSDLAQQKIWAISMFDATAKLQAGILSGNYANLGFFDQCLEISAETVDGRINGKYCLGQISTTISKNKSVDLTWGVCIPNSCQSEDIAPLILDFLSGFINTTNFFLTFSSNLCQTADDAHPSLSVAAVVTISIFAIIVFVVAATTALDYFGNKPLPVFAKSFSAIANVRKVFSYSNNQEQMLCLNGLKVISLFWIILLHEYSIFSAGPVENLRDLEIWQESLMSSYEKSGSLAVETFFVISGLLVSYNYLKSEEAGKRFNLVRFYTHRILRILPVLVAVVWISATLLQYFGSGPYWYYLIQYFQKPCEHRWWSSLLFVQNYVNTDLMCVGHSWYLDVDMQLFLLSPLLLLPLKKYKKPTITCIILLILASIALTFVLAWNNDLVAMSDETFGNKQLLNTTYYLKTHTRAPSWLIGFLCGVLIHNFKLRPFKLHKTQICGLWCVSVATLVTCCFGGYQTLRTFDYKHFENAFYLACNRPAFAVALCWVIFGCVFSYGGLVNNLLSLPVLQIISKLVYSVYLIHVTMMYVFVYGSKTSNRFSNLTLMHKFWGDCFFSMFLALFSVLFIEYPAIGLEKLIF